MDKNPVFLGLGKQLSAVLKALDDELTLDPVWNLKQTSGKIYLGIVWTKIKIPAKRPAIQQENKPVKTTSCVVQYSEQKGEQKSQLEQVDCETRGVCVTSANPGLKKKRKSPSTRKRDKQRRDKWIAQKRSSLLTENRHKTSSGPVSHSVGLSENKEAQPVSTACNLDSATETPSVSELSTPRRVNFPGILASRAELPTSPVLESPRQESPSQPESEAESLDSIKDLPPYEPETFDFDPPSPPGTGRGIALPTNINTGYVGPIDQRWYDRGYDLDDLVDLYDMDSAADLCSSCYSVGFMALMVFNPDGIRVCPRCNNEYIVSL